MVAGNHPQPAKVQGAAQRGLLSNALNEMAS